jgi:hypothetical protein
MHNFQPIDFDHTGKTGVLTASYEGVSYVSPAGDGKWATRHVGAGYQEDPKASRGSSEVKLGRLKSGKRFIATAEPFHGNYVVAYTEDTASAAGATIPRCSTPASRRSGSPSPSRITTGSTRI